MLELALILDSSATGPESRQQWSGGGSCSAEVWFSLTCCLIAVCLMVSWADEAVRFSGLSLLGCNYGVVVAGDKI